MNRRWRTGLVVLAAVSALVPTPHAFVERVYSTGFYAALQRPVTDLSNRVPFALFDVLILTVLGAWLALAARDLTRRKRGMVRVATRTIVWVAALYLVFLLAWGLNYRRTPLVEKLPFDAVAVTAASVRSLAFTTVERLNGLHGAAHDGSWPAAGDIDAALATALRRADRDLGGAGVVVVGRPKSTRFDWYFRRTATDGMTDPYFLETLVSATLLPFERPFVYAHEWSHLAGIADEGDANFLAWLACVQASPPAQYSGWLFLHTELGEALDAPVRADVVARLGPGPRADLAAIRARLARQVDPRLAAISRRLYNHYLKANRVESGIASYGHVVQLVLGTRFDSNWKPTR